jgi:hypothetical protein
VRVAPRTGHFDQMRRAPLTLALSPEGRGTESRPRDFILQLAESHLTPMFFRQILGRIERLAWHPA